MTVRFGNGARKNRAVGAVVFTVILVLWAQRGSAADVLRDAVVGLRPNHYRVTPEGPRDGGDFGPHTPGTRTSGLQEAFDACKRDRRDLYIVGGAAPAAFENPGGVYSLRETLRIPWMQDFRCDGGEAVLQYTQPTGDAIVMDSQMSCVYKFGLIVLREGEANGACLRIKPRTAGPDQLSTVVASRFAANALVGGGSRGLKNETFTGRGDGLVLDSSAGGIAHNQFLIHEILGCDRGIYLTASIPQSAVLNNWIRCPFVHMCRTHVRLGDPAPASGVLWNQIDAFIDSHGVEDSIGAQIFGKGNRLSLGFLTVAEGKAVVLEPGSADNLLETRNLLGRYTDTGSGSNRIRTQEPDGLAIETPDFPASGQWIENPYPALIEVAVLLPGKVSTWNRQRPDKQVLEFAGSLFAGQVFTLAPRERVRFNYDEAGSWQWRVLQP